VERDEKRREDERHRELSLLARCKMWMLIA